MTEEILPGLHRIEVPLLGSPLKAVNVYVIRDGVRSLVIDTGWNRSECRDALTAGLDGLGVELSLADFFITHMHVDHAALAPSLVTETSTVYFNAVDAAMVNSIDFWPDLLVKARYNGFPEKKLSAALAAHPAYKYRPREQLDFCDFRDGDTISIGGYIFTGVATPGHTEGHMCLYEARQRLLISGDHLLASITPNVSLWDADGRNILKEYLDSLDRVKGMDIKLVLPGHGGTFSQYLERIEEIKRHHQERAAEVLVILEKGGGNAFEVAAQMTWDMDYPSWQQFPLAQQWFATGEAVAHIRYLEEEGRLKREIKEGKVIFSLK